MHYLPVFILFFLALLGSLDTKAVPTSHVTRGHATLYDSNIGTHRRLSRQDVPFLGKNITYLSFHLDDDSSPIAVRVTKSSVWTNDSIVVVKKENGGTEVVGNDVGDCFLNGKTLKIKGAVVIDKCGKLTIGMQLLTHRYEMEEDDTTPPNAILVFRVTRIEEPEPVQHDMNIVEEALDYQGMEDNDTENGTETVRHKRDTNDDDDDDDDENDDETRSITIEVAVFLDANTADFFYYERDLDTVDKIRNYIVTKWNTVQGVFSDPAAVGAKVKIELKHIGIWWRNPRDYPKENVGVSDRLEWLCQNTTHAQNFDLRVLYTKDTGGPYAGMAYNQGLCITDRKCAVVRSPTPMVHLELHELGHSLGLRHDASIGTCQGRGFMGWGMSHEYLPCYRTVLRSSLRRNSFSCLYEKNVHHRTDFLAASAEDKEEASLTTLPPEHIPTTPETVPEADKPSRWELIDMEEYRKGHVGRNSRPIY